MPAYTQERRHAEHMAFLDELAEQRGIRLERDVPVGPLTTLRVGGRAERMATVETVDELVAALRLARDAAVSGGVLGKGSDLVVADAGISGLVIRNRAGAIEVDGTIVRAESGAAMATLVRRCTGDGLTGVEFGISIPGTVGGAVWANAGAHDGEMKDVVRRVRAWSSEGDKIVELNCGSPSWSCLFEYRDSRFKMGGEVVLDASIELRGGDPTEIAERVAAFQERRRSTQPLKDQNAGSVFRNPPGDHAGRLIDEAGLKGFRSGSASVSTVHANFIVADRGGTAMDVRAVGEHVRTVVADRFGVELRYEIAFVGDWPEGLEWPRGRDYFLPNELAGA
jgi:UDP-N-acetylmuramate dehydrogenase